MTMSMRIPSQLWCWLSGNANRQILDALREINQKVSVLMANQTETLAQLADMKATVDVIQTEVTKIGGETDGLIAAVAALTAAAGNVQTTPEFDAAFAAVKDSVASLAAVVKGVDDKVADAVA